jgi:hypothetical protein
MKYIKILKRVAITIFALIIIVSVLSIIDVFYQSKYGFNYTSKLTMLFLNLLFEETKLQTKYFEIDVQKMDWAMHKRGNNSNYISFVGIPIFIDSDRTNIILNRRDAWLKSNFSIKSYNNEIGIQPLIFLKFQKCYEYELRSSCDIYFAETLQEIKNTNLTAYDCIASKNDGILSRFVLYEDEYFYLDSYVQELQPMYDKFFENVRLKE